MFHIGQGMYFKDHYVRVCTLGITVRVYTLGITVSYIPWNLYG